MNEPYPRTQNTNALFVLVGINIAVYVLWQTWGIQNYDIMRLHFLVSAESVTSLRLWTLVTTMFSHVEPNHMVFNLFALWVFGAPVERVIGPAKFAGLYLLGGLAGSAGFVAWSLLMGLPNAALGASGAVMAISVVYACWFPNRRLLVMFVAPMPAWVAVGVYVALDLFGLIGGGSILGDNIAHSAHLGGALYGLLYGLPRLLGRDSRR